MAIRNFGSRKSEVRRKDPVRIASQAQTAQVNVVQAKVTADAKRKSLRDDVENNDQALTIVESEDDGQDPYNSTGRFMVEKLRKLGLDG